MNSSNVISYFDRVLDNVEEFNFAPKYMYISYFPTVDYKRYKVKENTHKV